MSTLTTLFQRVQKNLRDEYRDLTAINEGTTWSATATVLKLTDGSKVGPGDILEIESELATVIESPYLVDYCNESAEISATDTTLTVANGSRFAANDMIKIDGEILKVSSVSSNDLTVVRAQRGTEGATHNKTAPVYLIDECVVKRAQYGTTGATHADAMAVSIVGGWSKTEIIENLKNEIRNLRRIWTADFVGDTTGLANRRTLNDCDAISGFTASSDAIAATLNTTDNKEGTGCVNLGATYSAGTAIYSLTPTQIDASGYSYLCMWLYIADIFDEDDNEIVANDALTVRIGSDASNYKSYNVGRHLLKAGDYVLLVLPLDDFADTGTPVMTAMDYMAIVINDKQDIPIGDIKVDEIFLSTFPYSTNVLKYRMPNDVDQVNEVRLLGDLGSRDYTPLTNWRHIEDGDDSYILFDNKIKEQKPMEIHGQKKLALPSANTTAIDIPQDVEEFLVTGATIQCLQTKISEIIRSDKFSTKLQAQSPDFLDREARRMGELYADLRERITKSPGFAYSDWTE